MSRYRLELGSTTPRTLALMKLAKLRGECWQYLVFKAIDRYLDDHISLMTRNLEIEERNPPHARGLIPHS